MPNEWAGIVHTTIHEYIRGEEDAILRNRKLLAMAKERGRITYNHSGDLMDWKVRFQRAPMQGLADMDTLTFVRRNRWQTAQLDWRGYAATDMMTKMEKEKNKGNAAIIKRYSQIGESLMDDMDDQFGDELYIDGNASGNTKRIHGIESFFGTSGVGSTLIAVTSDTYAGLSTVLGNYGGSWSGTWPDGAGDSHYDFWSPLIVDYTDGDWAASTKTWPNTCLEALRYGITFSQKNKGKKGMLDVVVANTNLYRQFKDKLQTEEQINVQRGDGSSGLLKLGFSDVVNFDGVDVTQEYGVPATVAYGWCMSEFELCSLQSQLFVPTGPVYDEASLAWRFSIDFMGNAKFKTVRNFVKWDNVT